MRPQVLNDGVSGYRCYAITDVRRPTGRSRDCMATQGTATRRNYSTVILAAN